MPFGCLAIGEKKEYNNPSDVTDKYDLGQIVKSWVSQLTSLDLTWLGFVCSVAKKPLDLCLPGRSSVRFLEPRTEPQWRCTHVKSSWRRMEGRSARLQKMRSSFWRCEDCSFYHFLGCPWCNVITAACYQLSQCNFTKGNSCTKVQKTNFTQKRTKQFRVVGEHKKKNKVQAANFPQW